MATPEQICKLCLNIVSDNFETLDHCKLEMLGKITLNLDPKLANGSEICFKCGDALQKFYNFKMTCLRNEKLYLEKFVNCDSNIKQEEERVCRFCSKCLDNDSFAKFNVDEDTFLKDMLDKCLPEVELKAASLPLICYDCLRNCQNMFYFVKSCLNNNSEMKRYEENIITSNNCIDLNNASKFIVDIKNDDQTIEMDLSIIKNEPFEENLNSINSGAVANKLEACVDIEDENIFIDPVNSTNCETKEEKFEPLEDYEINIKNVDNISWENKTVTESNSAQQDRTSPDVKRHKCTECNYATRYKRDLERHVVVHKNSSDVTMHKCTECSFESRHKTNLQKHLLIHKAKSEGPTLGCSLCSYRTAHKRYLRRHMLVHEDNSKVAMHRCTVCGYETRHKRYLLNHLLIHKDNSEVPMHKCTECSYESKHKYYLQRHLLCHRYQFEGKTHKCTECSYRTGLRRYLLQHLLTHKDRTEVTMHKCTECSFETKYECSLQKHALTHKDNSEVTMHKCTECSYETKLKGSLQKHMLVHKDNSEVTMLRCAKCKFESKHKGSLRKHLLSHKN